MHVLMSTLKLRGNYLFGPLQLSLSVKLTFDGQECLYGFVKGRTVRVLKQLVTQFLPS